MKCPSVQERGGNQMEFLHVNLDYMTTSEPHKLMEGFTEYFRIDLAFLAAF